MGWKALVPHNGMRPPEQECRVAIDAAGTMTVRASETLFRSADIGLGDTVSICLGTEDNAGWLRITKTDKKGWRLSTNGRKGQVGNTLKIGFTPAHDDRFMEVMTSQAVEFKIGGGNLDIRWSDGKAKPNSIKALKAAGHVARDFIEGLRPEAVTEERSQAAPPPADIESATVIVAEKPPAPETPPSVPGKSLFDKKPQTAPLLPPAPRPDHKPYGKMTPRQTEQFVQAAAGGAEDRTLILISGYSISRKELAVAKAVLADRIAIAKAALGSKNIIPDFIPSQEPSAETTPETWRQLRQIAMQVKATGSKMERVNVSDGPDRMCLNGEEMTPEECLTRARAIVEEWEAAA